jgi:hypothetical protein
MPQRTELLAVAGRKAASDEALCAHRPQPADPTDPGNAADLGTPQGFETGFILLKPCAMTAADFAKED